MVVDAMVSASSDVMTCTALGVRRIRHSIAHPETLEAGITVTHYGDRITVTALR
jgi:hypothetical protein